MANAGMRGHLDSTTRAAAGFGVDWLSQIDRSVTMPPVRHLAAILDADVAGYSRLMGTDEEGTHERLTAHFRGLVDPKIKEHRIRTRETASWLSSRVLWTLCVALRRS